MSEEVICWFSRMSLPFHIIFISYRIFTLHSLVHVWKKYYFLFKFLSLAVIDYFPCVILEPLFSTFCSRCQFFFPFFFLHLYLSWMRVSHQLNKQIRLDHLRNDNMYTRILFSHEKNVHTRMYTIDSFVLKSCVWIFLLLLRTYVSVGVACLFKRIVPIARVMHH